MDVLSSRTTGTSGSLSAPRGTGCSGHSLISVTYGTFASSALGTDWTLVTANGIDSVRLAERFAAAAQVMLAALARDDLCLVQTQINIRIENTRGPPLRSALNRFQGMTAESGWSDWHL